MKTFILRKKSKRRHEVIADAGTLEKLAGYGLTEKEIADIFHITEKQFYRAIQRNREMGEIIFRGKTVFGKNVVESLYSRAMGYSRDEITYTKNKGVVAAHPVKKYYPPDMKAIVFWLKNRMPAQWREKIDQEKGTYLVSEEQFKFLMQMAAKRMKEMM
ncbi:MAG: hypothetical protein EHM58_20015 [Ignavibacteriae bacterium]|nr:MAG: hypothetical protein EHM58_20015 [Ignavibacteriota bacterium]